MPPFLLPLLGYLRAALPIIKRHWKLVTLSVLFATLLGLTLHYKGLYQADERQITAVAERAKIAQATAAVFKAHADSLAMQLTQANKVKAAADSVYKVRVAAAGHDTVYHRETTVSGDTAFIPITVGDLPSVQNIETAAADKDVACGVQKDLIAGQLRDMQVLVDAQAAALEAVPDHPHKLKSAAIGATSGVVGAGIGAVVGGPVGLVAGGVVGTLIGLVLHD